jgi:antitoxin MazE
VQTKIQKWGNSLGLRIPRALAIQAQVEEGSMVDLTIENGSLRIHPLKPRRYILQELLKGITPHNLHDEILNLDPVGREEW